MSTKSRKLALNRTQTQRSSRMITTGGYERLTFEPLEPRWLLAVGFLAPSPFSIGGPGTNPVAVNVGDFNNDGKKDLVTANLSGNNLSVILGNGSGGFGTASFVPTSGNPYSVAVGDVNGDSNQDLIATATMSNGVRVFLGDGLGGFVTGPLFSTGSRPHSVIVGDFNADSKLDLATANFNSDDASVLFGDGLGSFATATNFAVGVRPISIVGGDFNGDGKTDLATANNGTDNVSVLFNNGSGGFGTATDYAAGIDPYSIAIGDFNNDGKTDLVTANYGSNNASVFLNNGSGGFGSATNFAVGTSPQSVAVSDFDGDGNADLATANGYPDYSVSVLRGVGSGSFDPALNFPVGLLSLEDPRSVAVADFNGDARVDMATANFNTDDVSVFLNNLPPINLSPVTPLDNDSALNTVVEGAANGTVVGVTAYATDPNGDTVTYSLTNSAGGRFAIDSIAGVVTVANGSLLDYEVATSHSITVQASDGVGGTSTQSFTINLSNVTAVISGTVFLDVNGNGLFDGGTDSGIDGVTIKLLDMAFVELASDVTEMGGVYAFIVNDEFGTYRIREIQPAGLVNGAAILGSAAIDSIISADEMQLTLAGVDASDYDFTEVGQSVQSGDTATVSFWQSKHGRNLIGQGGPALVNWLNANFDNIFGNTFSDGLGGDNAAEVAKFYKNEFFTKKIKGNPKVDAQFMATAFAAFFTSSNLSGGNVAASYGFNVTATGLGAKVFNVGANGAAFGVANDTNVTIMSLLLATNDMTGGGSDSDGSENYSNVYDANGDGVIDAAETALRIMADNVYSALNEAGKI